MSIYVHRPSLRIRGSYALERKVGKKARIYIRCHHCREINDVGTMTRCGVIFRGEGPTAQLSGCWLCRECQIQFGGSIFEGIGFDDVIHKGPLKEYYPEIKRILDGTGYSLKTKKTKAYLKGRFIGPFPTFRVSGYEICLRKGKFYDQYGLFPPTSLSQAVLKVAMRNGDATAVRKIKANIAALKKNKGTNGR